MNKMYVNTLVKHVPTRIKNLLTSEHNKKSYISPTSSNQKAIVNGYHLAKIISYGLMPERMTVFCVNESIDFKTYILYSQNSQPITVLVLRDNKKENTSRRPSNEEEPPMGVLTSFIEAAMNKAVFEELEDSTIYGEIPQCQGVWANEKTLDKCREVLREVLEEWLVLKIRDGDIIPVIDHFDLNQSQAVEENWSQ